MERVASSEIIYNFTRSSRFTKQITIYLTHRYYFIKNELILTYIVFNKDKHLAQ